MTKTIAVSVLAPRLGPRTRFATDSFNHSGYSGIRLTYPVEYSSVGVSIGMQFI